MHLCYVLNFHKGSIYAYSSRLFQVNGHSFPYAWNHTIEYEPVYGHMPYLVQRMNVDNIDASYDQYTRRLKYDLRASIAKGMQMVSFLFIISSALEF